MPRSSPNSFEQALQLKSDLSIKIMVPKCIRPIRSVLKNSRFSIKEIKLENAV